MMETWVKSVVGFAPTLLVPLLGMSDQVADPAGELVGMLTKGGMISAGFFCSMWLREKKSHGETWKVVERVREERDVARRACADCPGNEIRRKKRNEADG